MEKSSFFNSVNGDRKYDTRDWANYFNKFITNGVFPNPSTNLQVMAGDGMNVIVKAGPAWINGYCYENTSDLTLTIEAADGVLNRIDRIVIRLDTIGRAITTVVKKGTFASSPVAPSLQRDADAYELGIADITIAKGTVSISQVNISDIRLNTSLCGVVNSLIQVDTETLFAQYEAGMQQKEDEFSQQFIAWFQTIQGTLSGDVAGNLLNLINTHKNDTNNPHQVTASQVGAETPAGAQAKADAAQTAAIDALNTHKNDNLYQVAGGTATAITLTISETLVNGLPVNYTASASNAGAVTTINGKKFFKPNSTTSPNLVAGKPYTAIYNSSGDNGNGCFFIKASAEGNTVAAHVLAGDTFSNDNDTGLVGTMPDLGSPTYTVSTTDQTINGYVSNGKVKGESNLIDTNIKSGIKIGNVTGKLKAPSIDFSAMSNINFSSNEIFLGATSTNYFTYNYTAQPYQIKKYTLNNTLVSSFPVESGYTPQYLDIYVNEIYAVVSNSAKVYDLNGTFLRSIYLGSYAPTDFSTSVITDTSIFFYVSGSTSYIYCENKSGTLLGTGATIGSPTSFILFPATDGCIETLSGSILGKLLNNGTHIAKSSVTLSIYKYNWLLAK